MFTHQYNMKIETQNETRVWKHALYGVSLSCSFKIQTTPLCCADRIGTRSQANNWVKDWLVDENRQCSRRAGFCFNLNTNYWRSPKSKCSNYNTTSSEPKGSGLIIRFIFPVVFINNPVWNICTCLIQLYLMVDICIEIYYIKNKYMFR